MNLMAKYLDPICQKIQQKLEKYKEASIDCTSIWLGGAKQEVNTCGKQFVVDMEKHSCAFNRWDLTGIPYKHAVNAIAFKKERAKDYVLDFYKTDTYIALYSHHIQPCNGPNLWSDADMQYFLQYIKFRQGSLRLIEEEMIKMKYITLIG